MTTNRFYPVVAPTGVIVRFDTASGSDSPATIYSVAAGLPIPNGITSAGALTADAVTGRVADFVTVDGTTTLYQKTLNDQGTVTAVTATLIGAAVLADAAAVARVSSVRVSNLLGTPFTDNCYTTASATPTTTTGTSEVPFNVLVGATDIRLIYGNWFYNNTTPPYADVPNPNAITIKAAIRVGSNIYTVTFGGSTSATIAGGGFVQSDPVPISVVAGSVLYARTEVTPVSGWYATRQSGPTATGMGGFTVTTGLCVPGAAAITETASTVMYAPMGVVGRVASGALQRTVVIVGDSLAAGSNDYSSSRLGRSTSTPTLSGGGYIARGLYAAGIPWFNTACSSDQAQYFVGPYGSNYRWLWESAATTVICEYGRNDVSASQTLAQIQANLITIWSAGANRGQRVIQCTVTPLTTSTDGFVTTTNQSFTSAQNTVRVNLNQWLRAGAPVTSASSLTPVAIGTVGALLMGSPGHPLFTVFDASTIAESSQDSGLWTTFTGRTITDFTMGSGSTTGSSTSQAQFTTADVGALLTSNSGAAGVPVTVPIISRNSATQVTTGTASSTAVTAASASIGVAATKEGLHPSGQLATLMAACIDSTKIL